MISATFRLSIDVQLVSTDTGYFHIIHILITVMNSSKNILLNKDIRLTGIFSMIHKKFMVMSEYQN